MKKIYARQPYPDSLTQSIFLAGPTPRSKEVASWRPEALRILETLGFTGAVFLPEDSSGSPQFNYLSQVDWEEEGLRLADAIVFWIPRDLDTLPGFTTNIEWGVWHESGKAILGYPIGAPKMDYIHHYAQKHNVAIAHDLESTLKLALDRIGDGAARTASLRKIPVDIWESKEFQRWYSAHVAAGHRIEDIDLQWDFRQGTEGTRFSWILQPSIHIPGEDRTKSNEFVVFRPDISAVVAYHPGKDLRQSEVVLVREFRSSGTCEGGFVWELPGGSSPSESTQERMVASAELAEETGVSFPHSRFRHHAQRQLSATMLAHHAYVYSLQLEKHEVEQFKSQAGKQLGESDTERTYVEVQTVDQILSQQSLDWSNLGMLLSVLSQEFAPELR